MFARHVFFFYAGISRFSLLCRERFKLLSILEVHKAPPPTLHEIGFNIKSSEFLINLHRYELQYEIWRYNVYTADYRMYTGSDLDVCMSYVISMQESVRSSSYEGIDLRNQYILLSIQGKI